MSPHYGSLHEYLFILNIKLLENHSDGFNFLRFKLMWFSAIYYFERLKNLCKFWEWFHVNGKLVSLARYRSNQLWSDMHILYKWLKIIIIFIAFCIYVILRPLARNARDNGFLCHGSFFLIKTSLPLVKHWNWEFLVDRKKVLGLTSWLSSWRFYGKVLP